MLLLAISVGWGAEETFNLTDLTTSTSVAYSGGTQGVIKVEAYKTGSETAPTYYKNGNAVRFYKNNNLVISSTDGSTITSIQLSIPTGQTDYFSTSNNNYSSTTHTWTGTSTSITFHVTANTRLASIVVTYSNGSTTETVETPTFSPAGGEYTSAQNVTINCATSGATIHYTTDGTTPTASSATYSSAIPVSSTTTIKAFAVKSGMNNSAVAEATYTINSQSGGITQWVLTSPENLVTGDVVLIVDQTSSRAMSNNNGTTSAPTATPVTLSTDKSIASPAAANESNLQWTVTKDGSNFQFGTGSNYLYCTNTNNGVRVGTNSNNVFTISTNWLMNSATSRYVGVYNNADWRCYNSSSTNIENTVTKFYKRVESGAFTITLNQPAEGGSISASAASANSGQEITLTATPATGYEFTAWDVKDAGNNAVTVTDNKFTMPSSNVTVTATFSKVDYNIYRTIKTNGTVSSTGGWLGNWSSNCTLPNGAIGDSYVVTCNYGDTVQFKAGTNNGYQILDANVTAVDGNNQPVTLTKVSSDNSGTVFSFKMPTTTVTITANFTTYYPTIRLAGRFDGNTDWRTINETCPAFDFNGTTYTIDAYFTGEGDGNYFFITEDGVEKHPTANGNWVVQNTTGTATALGWQGSGNFQIDNGVYTITMPADRSTIAFTKHEPTVTISPADGSEVEQGTTVTATSTLTGLVAAIKATDTRAAGDVTITCNPATLSTVGSGQTATATAAIGNYSVSATATYTVVAANNSNKYQRITSTNDLEVGKKYLLVCESGSYAYKGGKLGENISISSEHVTELSSTNGPNVKPLTMASEAIDGTTYYNFAYTDNGTIYYLANINGSNNDGMGTETTLTDAGRWEITAITSNGVATISNKGTGRLLRAYSSNTDFRAYTGTSNQTVQLYKQIKAGDIAIEYATVTGGSASGATDADAGDVITVTLIPAEGYASSGVTVTTDDANYQTLSVSGSGNSYSFTVPNDFAGTTITVTPAFATAYAITYVAEPTAGGTVTGPASAVYDATVEVTVTPNSDYRLVGQPTYTYNGTTQNLTGSGPYTFNMPGYATTVTANFEKIPYAITVTSTHGEVTGLPATATSGTSVTFTVTPQAGYVVSSVSGTFNNGNSSLSITDNGNGSYTFNMPAFDVAITVTYFSSEDYELLTDLSDINEEDTYLIVGGAASGTTKDYVMGTTGSGQAEGVALNSSNYDETTGIISSTETMAIVNFVVKTEGGSTTYALHTAKGYLNNTSSSNSLSYSTTPAYASISLGDNSKATIQLVDNSSKGLLSYNTNGNMWKFYGGAQGANYIFKVANANKVKRPTVTGAAGEYLGLYNFIGKDNVSLSCATEDATMEYSLDGGTTWLSYSEAFEITTNAAGNTVVVQARATKSGMEPSDVVTATFTCVKPTAPTFGNNEAGAYVNPVFVYPKSALNDRRAYGEESVTFCYTTDNTTPTTASTQVSTSNSNGYYIYLDDDALLKVVTVINGIASDPAGGEYTFSVAAPTFSLPGGNYDGNQQTRLSTETKTQQNNVSWNTTIYYTTGNTPFAFNEATGEVTSEGWVAYDPTNPYVDILAVNGTTTIKAVTLSNYMDGKAKYVASSESTQTYVLTAANLAITISPAAGTYVNEQTVTLGVKNNLGDYLIYYTTDGSDPSTNGTEYSGPITIDHDMTIKVYAIDGRTGDGGTATAEAAYKIGIQPVVYSPIPGAYYSGDDDDITVEMFSVTPNAKVYYTVAEGEGNIPADPTTSSTLYSGDIPLETGKTYNFKAIAVIGNRVSTVSSGTYTIHAKGDGWLNVQEMNEDDNYSTADQLLNPVQVVYMSTWRNNGTKPEFCFVRDNSGYGLVYFGGSSVSSYNNYTKFHMGDWLDGNTISGKLNVWSSSFINELGTSGGSITSWPSTSVGNTAILPEETTNLAITQGWTYQGAYTGNDYAQYIDSEKNLFGHYVHMRKNTITNVTGDGGGSGKHIGIITDQSGVPLNYYDGFYLFSGYNNDKDYDQAFFNSIQSKGGTFDIYAIVYFYGPNANNASYSNAPYEIFPIDFEWIYPPKFNKETGTYHESQTVTLTCETEGAQIWYKTSEMEAYELYTGPFTVDATTTIESYSTMPTKYNDQLESVVETITITIGTVEAPVITPESVVKTVGESVTASISCETEGATIYYTTDGSDPKTSTTRMVYTAESDMTFTTTTTVRAIAMQDDFYSVEAESKTYTFVKSNGIVYDLVTNASDLDENSVYVIVNKANHMAMGNVQDTNNRDASGVKFVNETTKTQVYGNDDVAVFTLKKSGNNWLLQTNNGANVASNGYLSVGNGNVLLTSATADENSEATIVIGDNNADVDKAYESHISFIYNSETTRYLRFWLRDLLFNAYTGEVNQPVFLYKKEATPLALIEKEGIVDKDYTIADQLVAVYSHGASLWCKDQGNVSIAKTEIKDGQTDYMKNALGMPDDFVWDQSNWVELDFSNGESDPSTNVVATVQSFVGKYIKPASLTGTLVDKLNYRIAVKNALNSIQVEVADEFTPNTYCTVNFLEKNLNVNGGDGAESVIDGMGYFYFVNPKVQEYVEITYAVWDVENELFVVPAKDGLTTNANDFDGAFAVDWSYNQGGDMTDALAMNEQLEGAPQVYKFKSIVRRPTGSTYGPSYGPRREPAKSGQVASEGIIVYPIDLTMSNDQIITAVETVNASRQVAGVDYYNVAGLHSDKPFSGINIVVTRYTDGTMSTAKVVH